MCSSFMQYALRADLLSDDRLCSGSDAYAAAEEGMSGCSGFPSGEDVLVIAGVSLMMKQPEGCHFCICP